MINVITTIAPENDLPFDYIQSFKTDNYVGMYDYQSCEYIMMCDRDVQLYLKHLGDGFESLAELDAAVYNEVEEHIVSVSESSEYQFKIIED